MYMFGNCLENSKQEALRFAKKFGLEVFEFIDKENGSVEIVDFITKKIKYTYTPHSPEDLASGI